VIRAVVVMLASGIAVAAARPGKVVKVERTRSVEREPIALCSWQGGGLTCFGSDVEIGDELRVVDESGNFQRVEVTRIEPNQMACSGDVIDAEVRVIEKRSAGTGSLRRGSAFGGLDLVPGRSKLIDASSVRPPAGAKGPPRVAVDIDGDGSPEVVITARDCPETRRKTPGLVGRRNVQSICIGTWRRANRRGRWHHVSDSALHLCP
jgi:hypothetical protein